MEMVSFSRDEYKMLRRRGRLTPEARHKLVDLRETYELNNAHRLGFDTLYPPNADTCCGDADAADALLASYDELLAVSKQLQCAPASQCRAVPASQSAVPPQAMPQAVVYAVPYAVPQAVPQAVPPAMPQAVPQAVPPAMPPAMHATGRLAPPPSL